MNREFPACERMPCSVTDNPEPDIEFMSDGDEAEERDRLADEAECDLRRALEFNDLLTEISTLPAQFFRRKA